ncbi:MAG: hypothetical protein JST00_28925 [Deltaproteobacteria bacterium]|nr:hypothetical protein [Deltaproteobacteria bacterium]
MPLLLGAASCVRPASDARAAGGWSYEVEAPGDGSRTVVVEATFDNARTDRLAIAREAAPFVKDMQLRTADGWRTVERRSGQWVEPVCRSHCTVRYRVDLGELAAACRDEVDCARRVGESTLSPALQWLVHPAPKTDVPVRVRVSAKDTSRFATGMHPADATGHTFAFRSYDLDEGSFTVFGPMRRYAIDVPSRSGTARIDLTIAGKTKYAMSDDDFRTWVADAASVITPLFGRFPVDRTSLFVVPARGEEDVVFGKVLSLAGASVVVVVGDRMPASARTHDWVLVHELFHLGFPTFRGEGRWLGEGLATYYEPILRARAGWTSETDVYRQFARNMPRGLANRGSGAGLAHRDDLDSIYWGGALFCFAADVRIREETRGKRSLDDVLRLALSRGGDATRVWTVSEVVKVADEATGTTVFSEMYDRHAARGERIDLDGLMASLGIDRGGAELDDRRPLAWVRRDIVGTRTKNAVARVEGEAKAGE